MKIGELPPEVQVKLLRVLQEKQIERLGNSRTIPVDVRIIAARNLDLEKAVADGKVRRDLDTRSSILVYTYHPIAVPSGRVDLRALPLRSTTRVI